MAAKSLYDLRRLVSTCSVSVFRLQRQFSSEEWWSRATVPLAGAPCFETLTRPGNFTDRMDIQLKLDNWLDEARARNNHEPEIKRPNYTCATQCVV